MDRHTVSILFMFTDTRMRSDADALTKWSKLLHTLCVEHGIDPT